MVGGRKGMVDGGKVGKKLVKIRDRGGIEGGDMVRRMDVRMEEVGEG